MSETDAGTGVAEPTATGAEGATVTNESTERAEKGATGAQAALERAAARRAAAEKGGDPNPTGEVTPTTDAGASAETDDDAGSPADGGTAAAGTDEGKPDSGSTVTAPDDWPEETKQRFAALPNDDARTMYLDAYKDMHRQFTESMQDSARIRKDHEELIRTVEAHGVDVGEANRILTLANDFDRKPREVLQQLANEAKVEIFFERPMAEGEIPDFKNEKEMADWLLRESTARLKREQDARDKETALTAERQRYKDELRRELSAAREKHGEPFQKAQTAVMERMVKPLSIEDAFNLVALPQLRQQADEGRTAKAEVAKLKAEIESMKKRSTQPPKGANARDGDDGTAHMSAAERAVKRAGNRKRAAANA